MAERRRKPRPGRTSVWVTRFVEGVSSSYVRVSDRDEDLVDVCIPEEGTRPRMMWVNTLTRSEARLLARRINQMLDATARR